MPPFSMHPSVVGYGLITLRRGSLLRKCEIHAPYILHLATHGFFAKEDPTTAQTEPEALLNDRQSVAQSKFFKNPMHRSGLALGGAQTTVRPGTRRGATG